MLETQFQLNENQSVQVQLLSPVTSLQKAKTSKRLIVLDIFILWTLITPSVVCAWHGIWTVMDLHPNKFPPWESFLYSSAMQIILALTQTTLHHVFIVKREKYGKHLTFLFAKMYTYTFTVISNLQFRGLFMLCDHYMGVKLTSFKIDTTYKTIIVIFIAASICMMVLKAVKCTVAVPVGVLLDNDDEIFLFPTRFKTKINDKMIGLQHPDTNIAPPPYRAAFLTLLDVIFSCLIVSPCVVGYWRSVWGLMDIHVLPNDDNLSALVSFVVGYGGHVVFCLFQKLFEKYIDPERPVPFYIFSRFYTECFAIVCVNGWRGPWTLIFNEETDKLNAKLVWTVTGLSVIALIAFRVLKNVCAPPCMVGRDIVKGYFEVLTTFRTSMSDGFLLYLLDCFFSVFVVGTLCVFVWRGAWMLIDIYLIPDDLVRSSWWSLILGYVITGLAFILQLPVRWVCDRLIGVFRLIVADLYILVSFIGTINVWRGIWNILDIYLLPDRKELGCWITHLGGFFILVFLKCSNSLLVRGVFIDGEEPGGECVVFPCQYLRAMFLKEHERSLDTRPTTNDNVMVIMNNTNHAVNKPTIAENNEKHDIVL